MLRAWILPTVALAFVTGGLGLMAGCSGDSDYNDADVTFASEMVPHHQQAVEMVDLTEGRDLSPEFVELANGIRNAQKPEIDEMTTWLKDWDKPVPSAAVQGGDHGSDEMDGMDMGDDMPGMMTSEEMQQLEDAPDATFETLWLQLMIEHHEGAVDMAETEVAQGTFPDAVELARKIKKSQTRELTEMKAMLATR